MTDQSAKAPPSNPRMTDSFVKRLKISTASSGYMQ